MVDEQPQFIHKYVLAGGLMFPFGLALLNFARMFSPLGYAHDAFIVFGAVLMTLSITLSLIGLRETRQVKRRLSQDRCPNCGYDLRASRERCPECGTEI